MTLNIPSPQDKELILRASKICGVQLETFCRLASLQLAREIIQKNQGEINGASSNPN